jgi:hypothetical protein
MHVLKLRREKVWVPCRVFDRDRHRPLRKLGKRLGSWTDKKFYQDRTLVSFTTPSGNHHMQWVKTHRIKEVERVEDATD